MLLIFMLIVPLLTIKISDFLYSPKGISSISAVILALSFTGYAILEMFAEVKR